MELHINGTLIYDTSLPLEEQEQEVQEHINETAYDYNGACTDHCIWQGDDTPGKPVRYEKLVHEIPTQEGAVIRTSVTWLYNYEYGHPACFSGSHSLKLEVLNG